MRELPLVSIVTPAFNQAEYLTETIESVLAQDYPNLEYIVLDDGSTDQTSEVLKKFDGRIRHERHANMGQAGTLNRGWGMASGSLIGYLSSDDRLAPHAVSSLVQALIENQDAAVAYCDFELIDAKGRTFRRVQTEAYDVHRLCVDLVCQPGPGALFRREVFDHTGGWAEHLRQVPDFEFWLRASHQGVFIRVPEVLAHYRVHDGSASFSSTTEERSMEIVQVMEDFWAGQIGTNVNHSMARAHLLAAKSHVQSGRLVTGFGHWCRSIQKRPEALLSLFTWRALFSGLLRRIGYRLWRRG